MGVVREKANVAYVFKRANLDILNCQDELFERENIKIQVIDD